MSLLCLPTELLIRIMHHVDIESLYNLSLCCKHLANVVCSRAVLETQVRGYHSELLKLDEQSDPARMNVSRRRGLLVGERKLFPKKRVDPCPPRSNNPRPSTQILLDYAMSRIPAAAAAGEEEGEGWYYAGRSVDGRFRAHVDAHEVEIWDELSGRVLVREPRAGRSEPVQGYRSSESFFHRFTRTRVNYRLLLTDTYMIIEESEWCTWLGRQKTNRIEVIDFTAAASSGGGQSNKASASVPKREKPWSRSSARSRSRANNVPGQPYNAATDEDVAKFFHRVLDLENPPPRQENFTDRSTFPFVREQMSGPAWVSLVHEPRPFVAMFFYTDQVPLEFPFVLPPARIECRSIPSLLASGGCSEGGVVKPSLELSRVVSHSELALKMRGWGLFISEEADCQGVPGGPVEFDTADADGVDYLRGTPFSVRLSKTSTLRNSSLWSGLNIDEESLIRRENHRYYVHVVDLTTFSAVQWPVDQHQQRARFHLTGACATVQWTCMRAVEADGGGGGGDFNARLAFRDAKGNIWMATRGQLELKPIHCGDGEESPLFEIA